MLHRLDLGDDLIQIMAGRGLHRRENTTGLQALAAIYYYSGQFDQSATTVRAALALNPNDPETLVQFGWRVATRGKWDEGLLPVERAIDRALNPPGW